MSIPASVPPPSGPGGFQSKGGQKQRAEKERVYGTPLPLLLPSSPLHPGHVPTSKFNPHGEPSSLLASYAGIISSASRPIVPACVGRLDRASASVWVEGADMAVLFNRGFFGKGTLSRSDPNWRSRRVELLKGGSGESVLCRRSTPLREACGVSC